MATSNYSIMFINRSSQSGSACLFQQDPNGGYNVLPLAWFTQYTRPGSQARFDWRNEYSFVWANTGQLRPGVTFNVAQEVGADPGNQNKVTLSGSSGGYQFGQVQPGGQPGTLGITTDTSVQPGQVSVGIGMSGAATFASQAQPNMMSIFNAATRYCIAFGSYEQGQVLDPERMRDIAQVEFSGNVSAITVTLNEDGSFTVQPS